MSKKISKDDIIESGLFDDAIKSADLFLNKARELESQLKSNLEVSREYFSNAQIEGSKSIKDLNAETVKVNATLAEYEKTQFAVLDIEKKQAQLKQELAKAQKEELKLTQELAKEEAKRLKQQKDNTSEYKKSSDALRELKKQLKDLSIAGKQNTKEYTELNKQFVELDKKVRAADASVGDFQRNVGNYPKQLKEMQKALMDLEPGTDEFIRLSKEAGELKDKINDSKDATKAFAAGAKTTQAKTIFGQVSDDLGDLDFQGASEKAKTFANVVKSISLTEIVSGLKSFGAAILDVGKALLTNPFTIIAAAISGLIYVTYDLVTSFTSLAETTKTVNEALEGSQKRIEELSKRQLDYLLRIKIAQGQLTKEQSELVKTDLKNLDERKQAQKRFSEDIIKLANKLEVDLRELKGKRFKEDDIAITITGKKELEKRKAFNRELSKLEQQYAIEYALLIKTQASEITAIKTEQQKAELDKLKNHEKKKVDVISGATTQMQNIQLKNIEERQDAELVGLENEKKNNEKFLEDVLANSKKNDEKRAKLRDEEIDRAAQTSVKILNIFENELKEKQRLQDEAYDKEIKDKEQSIDIQRRLAEAGKANTLAFEEEEKARLEREREDEKNKEIKRQKAIAFFKSYASYVEKDPNTALINALRDTFVVDQIAGNFFEGSEKIENDLNPAFNTGKDDYLVRVDGKERVLTGEQNKLIGDMSNDELAKLAFAHQNGFIKAGASADVFAENIKQSATLMQLVNVTKELQEIKQVIYNKPETSFEFDKYGDYIKTTIEKGFVTREKFKTPKPRI